MHIYHKVLHRTLKFNVKLTLQPLIFQIYQLFVKFEAKIGTIVDNTQKISDAEHATKIDFFLQAKTVV